MFGKKPVVPDAGQRAPETSQRSVESVDVRYEATGNGLGDDSAFRDTKRKVFTRLIDVIDAARVLRMEVSQGRAHIAALINEIVIAERIKVSAVEERRLLNEIADDMLGFGPLERFLGEDEIAEIMVNGTDPIYIETAGVVRRTDVRFGDNAQLLNVCQRIVSLVGRRVDESSPICDARLHDGSRVNVVVPPISLNGPALTIRRFQRERLTLAQLVERESISAEGAELLRLIARTRCNVLVVGGTGSGKTTLLNVLTAHIENRERIVTCEDTAELQLQQPHVVRMETRPPNIEGKGEITMRDLVRNCLRMRPDRIIVGEVRGPEAFDLLQAMNTGHDGSMGTLHANSPGEAVTRMTSLVTMGYGSLATDVIERMIASAIDIIIQVDRLRDGTRRITRICEVLDLGLEGIQLRNILAFEVEPDQSFDELRVRGRHRIVNRPQGQLVLRAAYFGERERLDRALGL